MPGRLIIFIALSCLIAACQKDIYKLSTVDIGDSDPQLIAVREVVNEVVGGYYIALPASYNNSTAKYPLLLFLHGNGQYGDGDSDLNMILYEAVPELISDHLFPRAFTVNKNSFSFIVLCPQFKRAPSPKQAYDMVLFAEKKYRINASRIYLSGFSEGGILACDVTAVYASKFAALVAISGVSDQGNIYQKCKNIAAGNVPVWVFHNDKDEFIDIHKAERFVSTLKDLNTTPPPKFTVFPAWGLYGHDAWTKATDPTYKEDGYNIYEWMLQYSK